MKRDSLVGIPESIVHHGQCPDTSGKFQEMPLMGRDKGEICPKFREF